MERGGDSKRFEKEENKMRENKIANKWNEKAWWKGIEDKVRWEVGRE